MVNWGRARLYLIPVAVMALLAANLTPAVAAPPPGVPNQPVCPGPANPGSTRCHARVVTHGGQPFAAATPAGPAPAAIQGPYSFPAASTAGAGETNAIGDGHAFPHP